MSVSRRDFFKISGVAAAAGTVAALSSPEAEAAERKNRIEGATATTSICPYCAVGCGTVVHAKDGKVVNIEGDPDHPINRGSLCCKGASAYQIANNPKRVTRPLYRAPGASSWKEVEWDWALGQIAKKIKDTRDTTFTPTNANGQVVNRCNGIASVGSAAMDNEECYLYQKWLRSLGLVAIEHQARV